ncbi:hypothetical protein BJY04DRAFT_203084 [Aspergillus karnatakaensis]|uniref:Zn(II)2Cys6 transcription factor domain-containing protein n=1 Tax=Aspergillus karnatakaensis TaxID=1810916 RepID=UPI003CCDB820
MDDVFFQALTTHYPTPTTAPKMPSRQSAETEITKEVEESRPRKKAQRSCLNCQRSHRTCGNERPCSQCIRRGIPSKCVDGNRKPPKYLLDPNTALKVQTRRTKRDLTPGFIDPAVLNPTRADSPVFDNMGVLNRDSGESPATEGILVSAASSQSGSELDGPETPPPPPLPQSLNGEGLPGEDFLAELLVFDDEVDIGMLAGFQPNCNSYSGRLSMMQKSHNRDQLEGCGPSHGFVIGSGWSNTFFPSGVDDVVARF